MGDVVLVHGAWHGAWCWDGVVAELRHRGVGVSAVELPFTGFADDVALARARIEAAGSGAVVCAHSYGGVVVNEAVAGLHSVDHILYLAAFVNTGGTSALFDRPLPLLDGIISSGEQSTFDPGYAHDIFYGDSDAKSAAAAARRLRPMVLEASAIVGPALALPSLPSTYVVCTKDHAIPPEVQYTMATRSENVIEWPTDHSPFLTRPGRIADLLATAARHETA